MRNIISRRAADLTQNIQKTNKNTPRRKLIHSFRGRKGLFYFHGVRTGANFSYKKQCKGRTCSIYESSSIYLSVSPILQSPIQESVFSSPPSSRTLYFLIKNYSPERTMRTERIKLRPC